MWWIGAAGVLAASLAVVALLAGRSQRPPDGVNPRHSMLVLPFDNLRDDRSVDWLREGSVSMLALNLSQWNDLAVVDHDRASRLLSHHRLKVGDEDRPRPRATAGAGSRRLDRRARRFHPGRRLAAPGGASVRCREWPHASTSPGWMTGRAPDARPLFDDLAAKLLDLSGAPSEVRIGLAQCDDWIARSVPGLPRGRGAAQSLGSRWRRARLQPGNVRSTPRLGSPSTGSPSLVAGSSAPATRSRIMPSPGPPRTPSVCRSTIAPSSMRIAAFWPASMARPANRTSNYRPRPGDADAWYGLGEAWFHDTTGMDQSPAWTHAIRAFKRTLALDPEYALAYEHVQGCCPAPRARRRITPLWRPTPSPCRKTSTAVPRQRLARRVGGPGPQRCAGHRAELGNQPADHVARPRGDGGRVPDLGKLRRGDGRGSPLQADRAHPPGAAVCGSPHSLRLGRCGPRGGRAPLGTRHRGATGL